MVKGLFIIVLILLSSAFYTLLERKVLSYMQARKGPNKPGVVGLPAPLGDALKLLSKESVSPYMSNSMTYAMAPLVFFSISCLSWAVYSSPLSSVMGLGLLFFLCVSSLSVYGVALSGWASNSSYASVGSTRGVAQTVSYEVCMAMILMIALIMKMDFSLSVNYLTYWFSWGAFCMWFIACLAETNRSPFDLAEGESELVSGYNVEYGASGFTLLFLAEYVTILLMSMVTAVLWTGAVWYFWLFFAFLFLWVRASYPRMRYDHLMSLMWTTILSCVMGLLVLGVPLMAMS